MTHALSVGITKCGACRVERDKLTPAEAFVLGIMVAGLQDRGRLPTEGTLCDRHGRFPHREPAPRVGEDGDGGQRT